MTILEFKNACETIAQEYKTKIDAAQTASEVEELRVGQNDFKMSQIFVTIKMQIKRVPMKINTSKFKWIGILLIILLLGGGIVFITSPQYRRMILRTRYAQMMKRVHELKDAQEAYWQAHGEYAYHLKKLPQFANERDYNITSGGLIDNRTRNSQLIRKGMEVGIFENGGGAPVIQGKVQKENESLKYGVYLDHPSESFLWVLGKKHCSPDTRNPEDWRYKFCMDQTGKDTPAGWGPPFLKRYMDPKTGEDMRPIRFEY